MLAKTVLRFEQLTPQPPESSTESDGGQGLLCKPTWKSD